MDYWGSQVFSYSGDGVLLAKWGVLGQGPGEFTTPWDIVFDASGFCYVVEDHRVQKFEVNLVAVEPTTWGRIKAMYGD